MAKEGVDFEIEQMTIDFLKQHDTDKKKTYLNDRQILRRQKKEIAVSNLSEKQAAYIENILYSQIKYEE